MCGMSMWCARRRDPGRLGVLLAWLDPAEPEFWVKFGVLSSLWWCYAASPVVWLRFSMAAWYAREAARSGGEVAWSSRCAKPVGRDRSCTAERNIAGCGAWAGRGYRGVGGERAMGPRA